MKVLIVRDGGYGSNLAQLGHYDDQISLLIEVLKNIEKTMAEDTTTVVKEQITVSVVKQGEAERILSLSRGINTKVIYITRGMLPQAKETAKRFPQARVILYTACLPEMEVIIVPKINLIGTLPNLIRG